MKKFPIIFVLDLFCRVFASICLIYQKASCCFSMQYAALFHSVGFCSISRMTLTLEFEQLTFFTKCCYGDFFGKIDNCNGHCTAEIKKRSVHVCYMNAPLSRYFFILLCKRPIEEGHNLASGAGAIGTELPVSGEIGRAHV